MSSLLVLTISEKPWKWLIKTTCAHKAFPAGGFAGLMGGDGGDIIINEHYLGTECLQ